MRAAVEASGKAGDFLLSRWSRRASLRVRSKNREAVNYVTDVDRGSEARIVAHLRRRFPSDAILGEEGGERMKESGAPRRWIVDPLDGTTNYLHGFPFFAVSIALEVEGDLKVGVVLDPLREELFTAVRGRGARLNGGRIRVSRRRGLRHALVATGFPFKEFSRMDRYLGIFTRVSRATAGVRRPGVASLDLCYLACGRVDGFWEFGLAPWDVAAGGLLVEEAGGRVTDMEGGGDFLKGDLVASNGRLHGALMRIVKAGKRSSS
ncbi:MAG: inositol monophosphatase [Acidobacteriota bacterium]|nr:MAG: inositol monophosphatase [Acidobacteriota bacterium]